MDVHLLPSCRPEAAPELWLKNLLGATSSNAVTLHSGSMLRTSRPVSLSVDLLSGGTIHRHDWPGFMPGLPVRAPRGIHFCHTCQLLKPHKGFSPICSVLHCVGPWTLGAGVPGPTHANPCGAGAHEGGGGSQV